MSLIPGQETKTPHAMWQKKKKKASYFISTSKMGLFGNSKNCSSEHATFGEPQACPDNKGGHLTFIGKVGTWEVLF